MGLLGLFNKTEQMASMVENWHIQEGELFVWISMHVHICPYHLENTNLFVISRLFMLPSHVVGDIGVVTEYTISSHFQFYSGFTIKMPPMLSIFLE